MQAGVGSSCRQHTAMCEIQSHRTLHDVADCANAWHGSTQHTQRLQPRPRAVHTIYKPKNGSSTAWMAQVAEKRPACSQRWHTIRAAHWSRIAKPHRFGPAIINHQSINQPSVLKQKSLSWQLQQCKYEERRQLCSVAQMQKRGCYIIS